MTKCLSQQQGDSRFHEGPCSAAWRHRWGCGRCLRHRETDRLETDRWGCGDTERQVLDRYLRWTDSQGYTVCICWRNERGLSLSPEFLQSERSGSETSWTGIRTLAPWIRHTELLDQNQNPSIGASMAWRRPEKRAEHKPFRGSLVVHQFTESIVDQSIELVVL